MEDKGSKGGRTRRTVVTAPPASKAAAAKPAATPKAAAAKMPAAPITITTSQPAPAPTRRSGPDRAELVRLAAYFRAERRGFIPGYEVEDWCAAEAEVAAKLGPAPAAAPGKPAARKSSARKSSAR